MDGSLAVGPFGPWGQVAAPKHETTPDGAVVLGEMPDADDGPEWRTGTAIDEFNAVYRVLAPNPKSWWRGYTPDEIDRMDISTVAVLMGVTVDPGAEDRAELERIAQARARGEDVGWGGEDFSQFRRPAT